MYVYIQEPHVTAFLLAFQFQMQFVPDGALVANFKHGAGSAERAYQHNFKITTIRKVENNTLLPSAVFVAQVLVGAE